MPREIERKFLAKRLPENIDKLEFKKILQGYLYIENEDFEIRFRKKGNHYFQTIKKGNGLNREEIETKITKEQFVTFWPLTNGYRIVKRRYQIPYKEHIGEYYYDKWNGTCQVQMYRFTNVKELDQWPEQYRKRKWVKLSKLSHYIKKVELQPIIKSILKSER